MKHNKNHNNAASDGPPLESVRFEFTHPTARAVCIAGTFNDWKPEAKPMHPLGGGRWLKETALPPGTYEYRLVVDGEWMPYADFKRRLGFVQVGERWMKPARKELIETLGSKDADRSLVIVLTGGNDGLRPEVIRDPIHGPKPCRRNREPGHPPI